MTLLLLLLHLNTYSEAVHYVYTFFNIIAVPSLNFFSFDKVVLYFLSVYVYSQLNPADVQNGLTHARTHQTSLHQIRRTQRFLGIIRFASFNRIQELVSKYQIVCVCVRVCMCSKTNAPTLCLCSIIYILRANVWWRIK